MTNFSIITPPVGTNVYTVTITDANGCTSSCTASNIVNPSPSCTLVAVPAALCLGSSANLVLTPIGGRAPYTNVLRSGSVPIATNISGGITNFVIITPPLGTNLYTVTITDANGCTTSCTASNVVNPNPVCTITPPTQPFAH